jgi:hypothetical protein
MIKYPEPLPWWRVLWNWLVKVWKELTGCEDPSPRFSPVACPASLPGDLWCITSYFNPLGYRSKIANFKIFQHRLRAQGTNLFVVECGASDKDFVLQNYVPRNCLLQVKSQNVIWQKERLLNLAVKYLPDSCDKVAWFDCDVYLQDDGWVAKASAMLEQYKVIQLYDRRFLLNKDGTIYTKEGRHLRGWMSQIEHTGQYDGGHPGYAWAARRDLLKQCPLYDRCITGVGDFLYACAVCNMYKNLIGDDFLEWADKIAIAVNGSVSYLPGNIFHLYHGPYEKRNYLKAVQTIGASDFDPKTDLKVNKHGCLEWATQKCPIHHACQEQLRNRDEDN